MHIMSLGMLRAIGFLALSMLLGLLVTVAVVLVPILGASDRLLP